MTSTLEVGCSPRFVVIEGADRVGKDVQAKILTERLVRSGVLAERFTTPDYSTPVGQAISEHLRTHRLEGRTSAEARELECLQAACRYQVAARVRVAMSAGMWAVCARWWPSALVYGRLDGLVSPDWIVKTYADLLEPDLCVLLRAPSGDVADRRGSDLYEAHAGRQSEIAVEYARMWEGLQAAGGDKKWAPVDAGGKSIREVADSLWSVVAALLTS